MVDCVFMVGRLVYETEPLICGILASEIYATLFDFAFQAQGVRLLSDAEAHEFGIRYDSLKSCWTELMIFMRMIVLKGSWTWEVGTWERLGLSKGASVNKP